MILAYIIKSTLCMAILLGFYKLTLEPTVIHTFKRFYLLGSLIFALSIPLLTITYTTSEVLPESSTVVVVAQDIAQTTPAISNTTAVTWPSQLLWSIYLLGVLLFATRFSLNLWRIKRKIHSAIHIDKKKYTIALIPHTVIPHSFFKWIFLSRKQFNNHQIADQVIAHEATHVIQRHSLDILLIELLQVFFWFNPLMRWIKTAIKTNHEFLADRGVLHQNTSVLTYQHILLSFASSPDQAALESPINYSLTKKRILMLSKTMNPKRIWASTLLLLPILALCVFLFNQEIVAQPAPTETIAKVQPDHLAPQHRSGIITPKHPAKEDMSRWLDAQRYTIILDENLIENRELAGYHQDDLPYYTETQSADGLKTSVHLMTNPFWQEQSKIGFIAMLPEGSKQKTVQQTPINYAKTFIAGAQKNGIKALVVEVIDETIKVNGKNSSLSQMRNDIDAATAPWTTADYKSAVPSLLFKNNSKVFLAQVNARLIQTKFAQLQGLTLIDTEAQENGATPVVSKQTTSPVQDPVTPAEIKTYNKLATKYADIYKGRINQGEVAVMYDIYSRMTKAQQKAAKPYPALPPPPPPPPAPAPTKVVKGHKTNGDYPPPPPPPPAPKAPKALKSDLPPPPPPPLPEEHLVKMRKLGGEFYYEDQKISFAQAVKLVNGDKKLNIETPYPYSTPPKTYIFVKAKKSKKKTKTNKAQKQEKNKSQRQPEIAEVEEEREVERLTLSGKATLAQVQEIEEVEEVVERSEIATKPAIVEEVEIDEATNQVQGAITEAPDIETLIANGASCYLDSNPIAASKVLELLSLSADYEVMVITDKDGDAKVYLTSPE